MIIVDVTFWVECTFCLTLCICPMVVYIVFGWCHFTASTVNPRNVVSQLFLIALIYVLKTGAPIQAYKYAIRCADDFCSYVLYATCNVGCLMMHLLPLASCSSLFL